METLSMWTLRAPTLSAAQVGQTTPQLVVPHLVGPVLVVPVRILLCQHLLRRCCFQCLCGASHRALLRGSLAVHPCCDAHLLPAPILFVYWSRHSALTLLCSSHTPCADLAPTRPAKPAFAVADGYEEGAYGDGGDYENEEDLDFEPLEDDESVGHTTSRADAYSGISIVRPYPSEAGVSFGGGDQEFIGSEDGEQLSVSAYVSVGRMGRERHLLKGRGIAATRPQCTYLPTHLHACI